MFVAVMENIRMTWLKIGLKILMDAVNRDKSFQPTNNIKQLCSLGKEGPKGLCC